MNADEILQGLYDYTLVGNKPEVVGLTERLAARLRRDGELSDQLRWDFRHSYPRTAERVTRLLMQEYETHAHGPEWIDDTE